MDELLIQRAFLLAIILSGVPLAIAAVIGVVVSVFQAATQVQEPSLVFIPKVVVVAALLFLLGGQGFSEVIRLFQEVLTLVESTV